MSTIDRVQEIVVPLIAAAELELYDLELEGGILQVLVHKSGGADIDVISRLARSISHALDEHDPIPGNYALEVGSPGLERRLRTPAHFASAVGSNVKIKTKPGTDGDRRLEGVVAAADDTSVTVRDPDGEPRTVRIDDIERARTTFEWGPTPRPNAQKKPKQNERTKS